MARNNRQKLNSRVSRELGKYFSGLSIGFVSYTGNDAQGNATYDAHVSYRGTGSVADVAAKLRGMSSPHYVSVGNFQYQIGKVGDDSAVRLDPRGGLLLRITRRSTTTLTRSYVVQQ